VAVWFRRNNLKDTLEPASEIGILNMTS